MSINVSNLLKEKFQPWVIDNTDGGYALKASKDFWVTPMDKKAPAYEEIVRQSLKTLNSTKIIADILHESTAFILIEDEEGRALCIHNSADTLSNSYFDTESDFFIVRSLNFLQLVLLTTRYKLPARSVIPIAAVSSMPIFEDDLLGHMPEIHVLKIKEEFGGDDIRILSIKSALELEKNQTYAAKFSEKILDIAYRIPPKGHEWLLDQILSAIRSRRLTSFYLELYKLLEFFFPLDSVFKLAKSINFNSSELELLGYCRKALSWNVNHQKGARSSLIYASTDFAEFCLGEKKKENVSEEAFKERAMEKPTTARHELTHQDFRSVSIKNNQLEILTESLLIFLIDAFTTYNSKLKTAQRESSWEGAKNDNSASLETTIATKAS